MSAKTQIEIANEYLRRVDETRQYESHPAVRALRDWYDNVWHGGKQPCEIDVESIYSEAIGSQRYADIVPSLLKLPAERDGVPVRYEIYDTESDVELSRLLREQEGEFTFTPKWRGKKPETYGPKEYHEGMTHPSRSVFRWETCPEPDTRPIDPFERFTEDVPEHPPVVLRGGALAFASFFGGILTAVTEDDDKLPKATMLAIGTNGPVSLEEIAENDDSEYSVLTVREEVNPDTGELTGRLALHCELGGVVDVTGGWYLMVYDVAV